uniref:Pentatricopeptide repeat-containing protein At5g67570ic-like isoform X1 n=1 Tax=Rhizophora mucronata TaxID=61149 RepID=A0A2P2MNA3_RHIMU
MEAATSSASSANPAAQFEPNIEAIKRRLIKKGVYPTPKIIHILRKKEIQKHNRKLNKIARTQETALLTPSQKQALAEESHFQTLKREYKAFNKAIEARTRRETTTTTTPSGLLVGRPWERIERAKLREIASGSKEFDGGSLKRGNLKELKVLFEDDLKWVLENDVEVEDDDWLKGGKQSAWNPPTGRRDEREAIRFLVARLSGRDVTARDWKLTRIMKQSRLLFTEGQLLRIVEGLGDRGKWEQALAVVEWAYGNKRRRDCKSKFVYTKLLSILGKERKPKEALHIFYLMHSLRRTGIYILIWLHTTALGLHSVKLVFSKS